MDVDCVPKSIYKCNVMNNYFMATSLFVPCDVLTHISRMHVNNAAVRVHKTSIAG